MTVTSDVATTAPEAVAGGTRPDTAPPDTAPPDTAPPDTAPPDTAPPGTAPPDTAPPDTAPSGTAPTAGPTPQEPRPPVAVVAASAGIESTIVPVGIDTATGRLEVPDFHLAGWYQGGGQPGVSGPTVVVGHVDSRRGPAVFFGLRDLGLGDVVELVDDRGDVARYSVTGSAQYPKAAFPTFDVFGATDGDILRLITCTGEFDRERRSYLDNLVVTATRIDDSPGVPPDGDLSG